MKYLVLPFALLLFVVDAGAAPVTVTAQSLQQLLIDREASAAATVVPANEPVVTAQVAATVTEIGSDVGARVSKGELLVRLDDDNARLALQAARASLAAIDAQIVEAEARAANAEELLEKSFISDEELIARRAALAALRANRNAQAAQVEAARLDLARTRITAPFDATVIARQAQVGGYVQPGSPVVTLSQADGVEVNAEIDQRYLSTVGQSDSIRFVSREQRWPVKLLRLSQVLDAGSRTAVGRFAFVAGGAPVGSSGRLVWNDLSEVVPVSLIVERDTALGVFIADGDTARFVPIDGAQQGRPAAATSLPRDAWIITRGQNRLQNGDTIEVRRE